MARSWQTIQDVTDSSLDSFQICIRGIHVWCKNINQETVNISPAIIKLPQVIATSSISKSIFRFTNGVTVRSSTIAHTMYARVNRCISRMIGDEGDRRDLKQPGCSSPSLLSYLGFFRGNFRQESTPIRAR